MDPLMELLLETANQQFGAPPQLPASLDGHPLRMANIKRADYVRYIETQVTEDVRQVQAHFSGVNHAQQCPLLANRLRGNATLAQQMSLFLDDVPSADMRISISLRLYAGYLDAAKTIAWGVTGRKNTSATRQAENRTLESRSSVDPIYKAGVQAAPHYKWRCLGQGI